MRKHYYLLSVFPVGRDMARTYRYVNFKDKKPIRVLERYTVFSRLNRNNKKQRDTVLLSNMVEGKDFIMIANSTAVTFTKRLKLQLDYFFKNEKTIFDTLENREGLKTTFIANYFGGKPLNVVALHHKEPLDLSREDIKAMMELYFDGEFDRVETFEAMPEDLSEYRRIDFYLIETHKEKSLKGYTETRYFLILAL